MKNEKTLVVIGMGYVGMPIAIEFSKKINVIGFDINSDKIEQYNNGIDVTNEVGNEIIKNSSVKFTSNSKDIGKGDYIIIAVPTPINQDKTPDLTPIRSVSELVGKHMKKNSTIIYESTVYPGVTEDICIPILEKNSKMSCKKDFLVGYSPERINPGDKVHRINNIVKVVSGINEQALENIADLYELIIEVGVHKVSSIKTAEATKVIENSQRDVNIAFMNEVSKVFNKMNINTFEVVEAMNTKWNSLKFTPGLVGGHCIGVDPYYFLYEAEKLGYESQIIGAGRRINDSMAQFVTENIVKQLILANKKVKGSRVCILGVTFKEDTPDFRNSKIIELIRKIENYGINVSVVDPVVNKAELKKAEKINIIEIEDVKNIDAFIYAVPHRDFDEYSIDSIINLLKVNKDEKSVIVDLKGKYKQFYSDKKDILYWNL
ncbi:nucleotide sugar dehydrogenase [Staphylococcus saprophyticus]|uniref:nucleotide sugar dehydrogenase n=1 Tax=Staphylococcus saprophyticus TaxID=29385 RepID=UPI000FF8B42E|nr:nucleotide sugar dehydrogenase [Staphylococcus saprophyticus]MDW4099697.1 nucleotide sugar dehydrogenase [Staphylococcus saprophyticus]MDW4158947.1 nucleotide sugar dehydrogenase [Staphylococcus saprophyticus]MDW4161880.1 nucleotide sugar dehydrogenase [Staphylococcus saprophyticus]MDW4423660.1 nucleotide sugar dehydrogenase [Staphylococcus saprophyticus]MDW4433152.1 nucleotide sugar dehydrogenase [Staphylococcus saprophyticus]